MSSTDEQVQGAEKQSLFRDVNERVEQLNEGFDLAVTEWVCECADTACTERISMTTDEYDGLRQSGTHFVVAPGHVYPEIERVAAKVDNYWVVEKLGKAGETAEQLDPRAHG